MIACLDVDYREAAAYAAGHAFHNWSDATPAAEKVIPIVGVHPYQPGQFFRRELPCLLAVLRELPPATVVVMEGTCGSIASALPGRSSRPLFITAAGISAQKAAEHIRSMHGLNRIPTLLKRVDSLCRQAA
jgi:deoxyribonuclease V